MDSDDESVTPTWKGVPGTIVLINVFDPFNRNTSSVAHAATCRMLRHTLRTGNSLYLGVCLYGIDEDTTSVFGTKNVKDVFPLCLPSLTEFKTLRSLDVTQCKQVKELELSEVLWHCSKMFANCKKQLSSRTVIMLTRLDTPPIQSDQKPTFKRVVDLVDASINIKIINISEDEYTIDQFYCNFLIEANKGRDYVIPKAIWNPEEIEQIMHQQTHRHLAVAQLKFEIGEGFSIGVGVYNLLIKPGQNPSQKKETLDSETSAIVTSVTKTVKVSTTPTEGPMEVEDAESEPKQTPLLKSEILHYQEYGGERILFTDDDRKKLQNPFGPPMIKLLGFKPARIMCKEKWFLKTGSLLYPNEGIIEGSTVAFKALHQACLESNVVAICVLCTRVNAKPTIVALSPCTHPLGLDVEIGFDIIHIPFNEHIRNIPSMEDDDEPVNLTEEQKGIMKEIVNLVKFDYKPKMFEDPTLQSRFRAVEALALNEDPEDPFTDTTKPDANKFQIIPADKFDKLFGPFGVAPKRPAYKGGEQQNKKPKESFDETNLEFNIKNETVDRYKVQQLKDILKSRNDPRIPALTGLKKHELVDLVYRYCQV